MVHESDGNVLRPSTTALGYETYLGITAMLAELEVAAERVIPVEYCMSSRKFPEIMAHPDKDGVLDEEFRWMVADHTLGVLGDLYPLYNPESVSGRLRGFGICGPASIALRHELLEIGELDSTQDGRAAIEPIMRLHLPPGYPDTKNGQKPIDHTLLLYRPPGRPNGWVHVIDPTGNMQWGDLADGPVSCMKATDLVGHKVYREEDLDDMLARNHNLYPFFDADHPSWDDIKIFGEERATPRDIELMTAMMKDERAFAGVSVDDDGNERQTIYWGEMLAQWRWLQMQDMAAAVKGLVKVMVRMGDIVDIPHHTLQDDMGMIVDTCLYSDSHWTSASACAPAFKRLIAQELELPDDYLLKRSS